MRVSPICDVPRARELEPPAASRELRDTTARLERFTPEPELRELRLVDATPPPAGPALPQRLDTATRNIDRQLARVASSVALLPALRPLNAREERETFLRLHGRYEPQFRYAPARIDLEAARRRLSRIDLDTIAHPELRALYAAKRRELQLALTLIDSRQSDAFTKTSLALYGKPTAATVRRARAIMAHTPEREAKDLSATEVKTRLEAFANTLRAQAPLDCCIRLDTHRSSDAAATATRVLLKKDALFSQSAAAGLAAHEIGWHIVTSHNGGTQPLHLFRGGTANYLGAQEGGAVLQELLTPGALTVGRLRKLAARTIALDLALSGAGFSRVFAELKALPHGFTDHEAYTICERIFRGSSPRADGTWSGVFSKDGVYLQNFLDVLARFQKDRLDLTSFAAGKMALADIPFVARAIAAGLLQPPQILPPTLLGKPTLAHVSPAVKAALSLP